jgi:hypothetical protein
MNPFENLVGPVAEMRAISTASGGTALSTTAAYIHVPKGTSALQIFPRNFSTAVVARLGLCPWLVVLKTSDAFAAIANVTDYSDAAQDNDTATDVVASSLDTLANGDAIWVGAAHPFRGLRVDVDAANGNAATLAAHYYNGSAMATLTPTDGTASGGATLAQDGSITWTVPTDWAPVALRTAASATIPIPHGDTPLYWARLSVSAALDSSTTLNSLTALPRSTSYAEVASGAEIAMRVARAPGGLSAIEALTDAGTANLVVNAYALGRFA